MTAISALFGLALLTGTACAQPSDSCPSLPGDSGMRWDYREGPDFSTCIGVRIADGKELFGVYFGNYPSFHPESASVAARGIVGGVAVAWYFPAPDANGSTLLETVFDIPGPAPDMPLKSHVWVLPQRRADLPKTFRLMARIRY